MNKGARVLAIVLPWVLGAGTALAAEPPPLKEGLWSIHNRDVEMPGDHKADFISTLCRSHESDHRTQDNAKNTKDCTMVKEELRGNEYTTESRCMIGGSVVESHSTTRFLGDATHTEVHVTYTPALKGVTHSTMIQDQRYLGACPAGAEPGDLMLPNGTVQHLNRTQSPAPQQSH